MGTQRPLALVYRGPASTCGCPEAVAHLLQTSRWALDVRYVGPRERLRLEPDVFAAAAVYAQPGGGSLRAAYREMRRHANLIRDYVRGGGRYLGFCLGAYLAGETPGFGLLPGDADRYIDSPGATTRTSAPAVIAVRWAGQRRLVYFQDGPVLLLDPARGPATVVARYENLLPAAVVAPYGAGAVGVVGPHPEATADWFHDDGLAVPQPLALDLGQDLIDRVLRS